MYLRWRSLSNAGPGYFRTDHGKFVYELQRSQQPWKVALTFTAVRAYTLFVQDFGSSADSPFSPPGLHANRHVNPERMLQLSDSRPQELPTSGEALYSSLQTLMKLNHLSFCNEKVYIGMV